MTAIHGHCETRFEAVRDAFVAGFDSGMELGASVAVTHHGETVLDLWGGFMDLARTRPWQQDTLVNVFSTTKIPTSLCVYILIDQGRIDIDLPIRHYWPEFTGGGKDVITTRHVLLHSSGLPGVSGSHPFEVMQDWDRMIALLEAETVWFEPDSMQAYHPLTFGFLIGEVIRRITGQKPGQFFRENVAEKLGLDFHIGLPAAEHARVAELDHRPPAEDEQEHSEIYQRASENFEPGDWTSPACMLAEIPASNGNANGRAIARLGTLLAMGGTLDDVAILSRETVKECTREHSREHDDCIGSVVARGLGLGRSSEFFEMFSADNFGWGGYGGSICMIDPVHELVIGYAPNGMEPAIDSDPRNEALMNAMRVVADTIDG